MKMHGICLCNYRGEERIKEISMDLNTNNPKIAVAVVSEACVFNKREAIKNFNEYLKTNDKSELFFWDEIEDIRSKNKGYSIVAEEWVGGFGLTKEKSHENFIKALKSSYQGY